MNAAMPAAIAAGLPFTSPLDPLDMLSDVVVGPGLLQRCRVAHASANSEPREPRVTFVTEAHRFKPGGFESRHTLSIKFSRGDNIFSETLVVYDYDCSSPVIHLKHLIMNELQLHQVVTLSDDVR